MLDHSYVKSDDDSPKKLTLTNESNDESLDESDRLVIDEDAKLEDDSMEKSKELSMDTVDLPILLPIELAIEATAQTEGQFEKQSESTDVTMNNQELPEESSLPSSQPSTLNLNVSSESAKMNPSKPPMTLVEQVNSPNDSTISTISKIESEDSSTLKPEVISKNEECKETSENEKLVSMPSEVQKNKRNKRLRSEIERLQEFATPALSKTRKRKLTSRVLKNVKESIIGATSTPRSRCKRFSEKAAEQDANLKILSPVLQSAASRPSKSDQRNSRKRNRSESNQNEDGFRGWNRSEVMEEGNLNTNFKSVVKDPPMVAKQLWDYKIIRNIAFAKTRRGFAYKCMVPACNFQTLVKSSLKLHLENKHKEVAWNKFCNICSKVIRIRIPEATTIEEFKHLHYHLDPSNVKETSKEDNNEEASAKNISDVSPVKSVSSKKKTLPKIHLPPGITIKAIPAIPASTVAENSPEEKVQEEKVDESVSKKVEPVLGNMRPWIKSNQVKAVKNHTKGFLISTYKCMSSDCRFATNMSKLFLNHLNSSHKLEREADKLMCAYCSFIGETAEKLIEHVDADHGFDKFQCSYCYYRSRNISNVLTHQELFHQKKKLAVVQCPQLEETEFSIGINQARKKLNETVLPIVCVFCRGVFYAMKAFLEHVATHEENLKARCIKCGEVVTKNTLPKHMKPCHNFGKFHCVYCVMGTNDVKTLTSHLANDHSSMMPFFCSRIDYRKHESVKKVGLKSKIQNFIHSSPVFPQPSPSVINATSLRLFKHPSIQTQVKQISSDSKKNKSEKLSQPKSLEKKAVRKVVASMPTASPLTTTSIKKAMESLLKPL